MKTSCWLRLSSAGAALLLACTPASRGDQGGGLLLIAIDALRADHLSGAGYDRATTPFLDALAREGQSFEHCYSSAPWLLPAHVALLSGCDPNVARRSLPKEFEGQVAFAWHIPERVPRLPVELLARGYATAAFTDHPWMAPVFGHAAGFQEYVFRPEPVEGQELAQGLAENTRLFEQWLAEQASEQPWFAYVHSDDLERIWHEPDARRDTLFVPRPQLAAIPPVANVEPVYFALPPSRWDGGARSMGAYEARYDGALLLLDEQLGRLFAELKRQGRYEDTCIVVVGTFGLGFGEAGLLLDHGGLSPADLHVPWIIKPSRKQRLEPQRIQALASLIDVTPTLLELLGIEAAPGMHGRSQVPVLRGAAESVRSSAFASCGLQQGYAVFGEQWCYELVFPGNTRSPSLVESWYGEEQRVAESGLSYFERVYRVGQPYPIAAPSSERGDLDLEQVAALRLQAARWAQYYAQTRRALHPPQWPDAPLSQPEVEELMQLGYLAPQLEYPGRSKVASEQGTSAGGAR